MSRGWSGLLGIGASLLTVPLMGSARAGAPVVTIGTSGAKIQVASASLVDIIDALARAAGFKVTYEGSRPTTMLYNAEIDTPTVPQTLSRLLDGQNLNYGVVFDLSGRRVTRLMILGFAPRAGATSAATSTSARPQPFATPRTSRDTLPPVDDEPEESSELEPPPVPEPTPAPPGLPRGPASPASPLPSSPFAPRPYGAPFGPIPAPLPLPAPSPSP